MSPCQVENELAAVILGRSTNSVFEIPLPFIGPGPISPLVF